MRDWGQAFGNRNEKDQGDGSLYYGWVVPNTITPIVLDTNGRYRFVANIDKRYDSLMHMRANDIAGGFGGVKAPGTWEMAIPNGIYSVTVAVGDPQTQQVPEFDRHTINVEGVNAINGFTSSGATGAPTRHSTQTIVATVSDNRLTIDAIGGINTKI